MTIEFIEITREFIATQHERVEIFLKWPVYTSSLEMTWTHPGHSPEKKARKFKYKHITIMVVTTSEKPKTTMIALTEPLPEADRPDDYSNDYFELQILNWRLCETRWLVIETLLLPQINLLSSCASIACSTRHQTWQLFTADDLPARMSLQYF